MCYKLVPVIEIENENGYYIIPKKRGLAPRLLEINEVGHDILNYLHSGIPIEKLTETLCVDYDISQFDNIQCEVQQDVREFVSFLVRSSILIMESNVIEEEAYSSLKQASEQGYLDKYALIQKNFTAEKRPFKFFIELTYKCNLRCIHCYRGEGVNSSCASNVFLEKERVIHLIDEIEHIGAVEVIFTGGEPFLHPNILDILKYATSKNFLVTVLTNGNYLSNIEKVKELKECDIYDIRVSIYGCEENHDVMTTIKGSYKRSIQALRNLNKTLGIGTAVYVVTRLNYVDHEKVINFFMNEGINVSVNPSLTPTSEGNLDPLKLRITPEMFYSIATEHKLPLSGTSCSAGLSRFRISPNGDLSPCELIPDITFGNVYKNDLDEILKSTDRTEFIDWFCKIIANHVCNDCSNRTICNFCPALFKLENKGYDIPSNYLCAITQMKKRCVGASNE